MLARALIVDNDPGMRTLLKGVLAREYEIQQVESGEVAIDLAAKWRPEIIFLDLVMDGMDGHEACRRLKQLFVTDPPAVFLISSSTQAEDLRWAFEAGADDYLAKPLRVAELLTRSRLHLRLKRLIARSCGSAGEGNESQDAACEQQKAYTAASEEREIQESAATVLTSLAESRNKETGDHLYRIREYALRLARELSLLPKFARQIGPTFLADIFRASPLHDFGKVGVPERIRFNPGRLTTPEYDIMKQHTVVGASILQRMASRAHLGTFLPMAVEIARSHHERWDGTGYPEGVTGDAIPLSARIVAAADVYNALTSARPHKPAWQAEPARDYILERGGTHFDPVVAQCMTRCFDDFQKIHEQYQQADAPGGPTEDAPKLVMIAST